MPSSNKQATDRIIGRGLIVAETVAKRLRKRLAYRLSKGKSRLSGQQLIDLARSVLKGFEPDLAAVMADTEIAAWLGGVQLLANKTPKSILQILRLQFPSLYPASPVSAVVTESFPMYEEFYGTDRTGVVVFPKLDESFKSLEDRGVFTRDVFDTLSDQAKQKAFTVAYQNSESVIEDIKESVSESLATGGTLRDFRDDLDEKLGKGALGEAHLETVYRTNVMQAFGKGQEVLAANPVMQSLFPYARYVAIDDGRVRDNHLALEALGIQGTNIYRADDPMWYYFTPPWGYNCRCSKVMMTLEQAARAGIDEAKRRLAGESVVPDFRLPHISFRPEGGFVGPGVAA